MIRDPIPDSEPGSHLIARSANSLALGSSSTFTNQIMIEFVVNNESAIVLSLTFIFLNVYGLFLPRLLKPAKFRYAKVKIQSTTSCFLEFLPHTIALSLVSAFLNSFMNPYLPKTAPFRNYVIFSVGGGFLVELHFYFVHRLLHTNKFLYHSVHYIHHSGAHHDSMEALEYTRMHPLEMLLIFIVAPYGSYMIPIVPRWFATYLLFAYHGQSLAGHAMVNTFDKTNPFFFLCLPFLIINYMLGLLCYALGIPLFIAAPSRHHLHHMDSSVNYGLAWTLIDGWMGTKKSFREEKEARCTSQRHQVALVTALFQLGYFVSGSLDAPAYRALVVYALQLILEMTNSKTNTFLRFYHHPSTLLTIMAAFWFQWDDMAFLISATNVLQIPSFVALILKKGEVTSALLTTPAKLLLGGWVWVHLVRSLLVVVNGSNSATAQQRKLLVSIGFRVVILPVSLYFQLKGGCDLAGKGRQRQRQEKNLCANSL